LKEVLAKMMVDYKPLILVYSIVSVGAIAWRVHDAQLQVLADAGMGGLPGPAPPLDKMPALAGVAGTDQSAAILHAMLSSNATVLVLVNFGWNLFVLASLLTKVRQLVAVWDCMRPLQA
jgi:hypothetical protein